MVFANSVQSSFGVVRNRYAEKASVRQALAADISYNSLPYPLSVSMNQPTNPTLKTCVQSGTGCPVSPATAPLTLYDVNGNIWGANPARYTYLGAPCSAVSSQCSTEVFTNFSAICTGPCATDPNRAIQVSFTIQEDPTVATTSLLAPVASISETLGGISASRIQQGF
jgi:hypothetical protein